MFRITGTQYLDFTTDFYAGEYPNQRFGQAFHNVLVPNGETIIMDDGRDIFYISDDREVKDFLIANVIDWND